LVPWTGRAGGERQSRVLHRGIQPWTEHGLMRGRWYGGMAAWVTGGHRAADARDPLMSNGLRFSEVEALIHTRPLPSQATCAHTRIPEGECPDTFCNLTCAEGALISALCVRRAASNGVPRCAGLQLCALSQPCESDAECGSGEFRARTCCPTPNVCLPRCVESSPRTVPIRRAGPRCPGSRPSVEGCLISRPSQSCASDVRPGRRTSRRRSPAPTRCPRRWPGRPRPRRR